MTPKSIKQAFIDAYAMHVCYADREELEAFLKDQFEGDGQGQFANYTSMMDALGMFTEGIKFAQKSVSLDTETSSGTIKE